MSSATRRLWLSCWTRCAARNASVRIDVAIKSTRKLMIIPPVTMGSRYLCRQSCDSLFGATEHTVLKSCVFSLVKETVCT